MAGRPLRPATRHRLGELLPHQQADRPWAHPHVIASSENKATFYHITWVLWSYPVLAPLSRCYPEREGRLPTYYSPVRRSTHSRRNFRARLACVRHAASVRSEPGSNSQKKITLWSCKIGAGLFCCQRARSYFRRTASLETQAFNDREAHR